MLHHYKGINFNFNFSFRLWITVAITTAMRNEGNENHCKGALISSLLIILLCGLCSHLMPHGSNVVTLYNGERQRARVWLKEDSGAWLTLEKPLKSPGRAFKGIRPRPGSTLDHPRPGDPNIGHCVKTRLQRSEKGSFSAFDGNELDYSLRKTVWGNMGF